MVELPGAQRGGGSAPSRSVVPLFEALEGRWEAIRLAWRRDVVDGFDPGPAVVETLELTNVDAYLDGLLAGDERGYLVGMREQGATLAEQGVPFHVIMQSLHLFEERCGDELRPQEVASRPELWNGLSALDRLMHAGIAALADGYFTEREEAHRAALVAHVRDTAATLAHRINNPLASMHGSAELLLEGEQDPKRRARLSRFLSGIERIGEALGELSTLTWFKASPYLSSVRIIDADSGTPPSPTDRRG